MIGGARVAPLDLVAGVEQQNAVRRRFHRGEELRQAQAARPRPCRARRAQAALDAVAELAPEAGVARRRSWPATPRSQRSSRQPRSASKTTTPSEAEQAAEQGADDGAALVADEQAATRPPATHRQQRRRRGAAAARSSPPRGRCLRPSTACGVRQPVARAAHGLDHLLAVDRRSAPRAGA